MTMASGLYVLTFRDALDTSNIAIDFLLDTHKVVLVTDTHTPNFDTHDDYADITNELATAGGYTQLGRVLTTGTAANGNCTPTFGLGSAGQLKYDLTTDVAWPSASFTARGAVWYADALATNNLLFAHTFGADYTATNGTFTIQLDALGAFYIDLVP
jgi:hypothetical protein